MRFEDGSKIKTDIMLAQALVDLTKKSSKPSQISILSVAHRANIHRNTVYYHFKNMAQLVIFSLGFQFDSLKEKLSEETAENFIAEYCDRNYRLLKYARHELGTDRYLEELRKLFAAYLNNENAFLKAHLMASVTLIEEMPGNTIRNLRF